MSSTPSSPHCVPHVRAISRTLSTQSIPRSVLSTPGSRGDFSSPPPAFGRSPAAQPERVYMGSPHSSNHSRAPSTESLIFLRHLRRQVSAASIPIFFDNINQPCFDLPDDTQQETLNQLTASYTEPLNTANNNSHNDNPLPAQPLGTAFGQDETVKSNATLMTNNLSLSFTSPLERPSNEFVRRRLSSTSGLTMESLSNSSVCTTESPSTPSDNTFTIITSQMEKTFHQSNNDNKNDGTTMSTDDSCCATTIHQRTASEASTTSVFTISEYYGSPDCSGDTAPMVALETLVSPLHTAGQLTTNTGLAASIDSITPPTSKRHSLASNRGAMSTYCSATTPKSVVARKLTFTIPSKQNPTKQKASASDNVCGAVTCLIEEQLSGASHSSPILGLPHHTAAIFPSASSPPHSFLNSGDNTIRPAAPSPIQARRRAIYPHTPLAIVLPAHTSTHLLTLDCDSVASSSVTADSSFTGSTLDSPSVTTSMYQIVQPDQFFPSNSIHPITPQTGDSFLSLTTNQIPFHGLDKSIVHSHESNALPVGELFRTLQIWFDQEGFREIAPVFRFNCYNREDDLLYFTTERVGYPFHYDSMQQVPVLRKVVAPDYEEAYVLLEGKSQRNAAGRRDFISRQANLDMKTAGKYVVEDKEGKGGKWIWRLVYEVEERKSLMGKPMLGERAFIPITFACSPEILDPSHARKPTLFNSIIKNMGYKKTAIPLDPEGRPTTRPRGKSLMGYHSRKLSESTTKLLRTPPRHLTKADSISSPDTFPSSTSAHSSNDDELSRAQAHFFKTIAPASASRLRPITAAVDEENLGKRNLRKVKTNEQLRRPFTADTPRSALSGRTLPPLPIVPVFGMAPQPSRATPTTAGNRFQSRPKTADDRRPKTAKSQLDVRRIAAASFYTPASGSP
ncbi:hypothetical protein VP01_546g3 [Puccinia sorghi]|uniref:Uncharacterized protein n=1 Tax=Puccinia sorghi TaxID=27349 RepID=A0A0L6UK92_9BASI|nr:hypothetical protein VP01_546g3 [Puccinia sorghi]